jgi:hypothetical protein
MSTIWGFHCDEVMFLWFVMLCSDVVGYECFRGPCSLCLQGEVNWRWRQHGPPKCWYPTTSYMALQPRRVQLKFLWKLILEACTKIYWSYSVRFHWKMRITAWNLSFWFAVKGRGVLYSVNFHEIQCWNFVTKLKLDVNFEPSQWMKACFFISRK